MLYQIKSYIQFYFRSKKKHGVHSPFIFDLGNHCFYAKPKKEFQGKIKAFRNKYLNSNKHIEICDFGVGSKKLKGQTRKVSDIARNAGITIKRANVLFNLINYTNSQKILEIGTSLGIGTAAMSLAHPNAHVTTLEGCSNTAATAEENFNSFQLKNINVHIGEFNKTLPKALKEQTFDLIYFDGNHQKEATLNYFNQCLNHVHNESVFIFDDIYWSKDMTEAWLEIINHPQITVSIDTFRWGMVFFRKEQLKEHFVIRV